MRFTYSSGVNKPFRLELSTDTASLSGLLCRHAVTIDGYEDVPENNEHALKQAASQQPIAVGICASPAMQFYGGGVIDTCCDELNHGVLVVGYGTDQKSNTDYWLVKNSWGGEGSWGGDSLLRSSCLRLLCWTVQHWLTVMGCSDLALLRAVSWSATARRARLWVWKCVLFSLECIALTPGGLF